VYNSSIVDLIVMNTLTVLRIMSKQRQNPVK